jgi:hypothetical protein
MTSTTKSPGVQYDMAFLWLICLVAAMGGLSFGYDWVVIGGAKPFYEPFFGISEQPFWQGFAMSTALFGCILGAALSGALSDMFGRMFGAETVPASLLLSADVLRSRESAMTCQIQPTRKGPQHSRSMERSAWWASSSSTENSPRPKARPWKISNENLSIKRRKKVEGKGVRTPFCV